MNCLLNSSFDLFLFIYLFIYLFILFIYLFILLLSFSGPSHVDLGTPIALERVRERAIERHGVLGLSVLKYHVGSGTITCDQLRAAIIAAEVKISSNEFNQVWYSQ
jgi:hypothetical protein